MVSFTFEIEASDQNVVEPRLRSKTKTLSVTQKTARDPQTSGYSALAILKGALDPGGLAPVIVDIVKNLRRKALVIVINKDGTVDIKPSKELPDNVLLIVFPDEKRVEVKVLPDGKKTANEVSKNIEKGLDPSVATPQTKPPSSKQ